MNDLEQPSDTTPKPSATNNNRPPLKEKKVNVPLESNLHRQINTALAELSMQLGFEVTMPKFLRKTVADNWTVQLERFRKLDPSLKRTRQ